MDSLQAFSGNVPDLLNIAALIPLSEFPFSLRPLTAHLQSIGYGWSVLTGARQLNDGVPDNVIRACVIVWAVDLSSAILATRCNDVPIPVHWEFADLPPVTHFCPQATGWTYGEILKAGHPAPTECGVYGSDGTFLFKQVRLDHSSLYYPSRTRKSAELPIAISLHGPRRPDTNSD